jgi:hypothetical protein
VTGHARHLDAPMVGRSKELRLLGTALERAVSRRSCHLVIVLGPAGVGKSRLVQELLATVQREATVLRGHCPEYGEGLTYWPIAEVIRAAALIGGPEDAGDGRAGLRGLLQLLPASGRSRRCCLSRPECGEAVAQHPGGGRQGRFVQLGCAAGSRAPGGSRRGRRPTNCGCRPAADAESGGSIGGSGRSCRHGVDPYSPKGDPG